MSRGNNGNGSAAHLGFEAKLWLAADKLRNNMDAAEYKHVVLGLIFLKYISDTFEEQSAGSATLAGAYAVATPEGTGVLRSAEAFRVPWEARWSSLQAHAGQPGIGRFVDEAMAGIERENPRLQGVLPKDYARPALDPYRLGELIGLIGTIGLGDRENRGKDILGRVYEYFLAQFARAEGKNGGQFYTPSCVVRLLVEMLAPYKGRIYDPCCGSGGMFVQSEKFVEAHGGKRGDIRIHGQESNVTTRRLAVMNMALRGLDADFGAEHADTFRRDLHPCLRADYILSNPPFNDSDWFRREHDERWQFGLPPKGNANFAWLQHFIHHLAPHGRAGVVLANGSLSVNQSGEAEIRSRLIEADLIECIVQLPGQLFYSTAIPVCVWLMAKGKNDGDAPRPRQTLLIDARGLGTMIDRVHRELSDSHIERIVSAYHSWRADPSWACASRYQDIPGFCRSVSIEEIREHRYALVPGRYVGFSASEKPDLSHIDPEAELTVLSARLEEMSASAADASNILRSFANG